MSLGSSGTITGTSGTWGVTVRSGRREEPSADALHRERALEHRFFERAWRQAVACLLDFEAGCPQRRREPVVGYPALCEDERVCHDGGFEFGREDVREGHAAGVRADEPMMLEDLDAGAVQPLQVEVATVLVDALAESDGGDGECDALAERGEQLGGVEAGRVAAPVGDENVFTRGEITAENVPCLADVAVER